ncbi:calcium-binding protein [Pseudophaeobacter sp. 1A16562]|uniref:hypothetical protein n=1 Tax=Pseudophaeobacter sp. 1A16562 TaxID=3098143 RepID=UPI0034D5E21B
MTTFSGLSIVNNSALTLINASASDRGAQARVESGDQGTAWGVDRLNSLAKAEIDYRTKEHEIFENARGKLESSTARRSKAAQSKILAERYHKLAANMAAALENLGGQERSFGGTVVALFKTPDSDALSIVSGKTVRNISSQNEASFAISAKKVRGVGTEGGNDAISIEADWVESVGTDRDGRMHARQTKSGNLVLGWRSKTVSNDAVAIKAKRVSGVSTKGGNDAIAIESDLVKNIHAGEGNDSVAIRGGVVIGIYGADGQDTISVDAGIGASAVTQEGKSALNWMSGFSGYTRAETAEERVRQATAAYLGRADIHGGAGDDFISVTVQETLSVNGGTGNDTISIGGGTVAMSVGRDAGHDTVQVARGAELMLEIDTQTYTAKKDGNDLIITHAGGSVTIKDYEQASAIAIKGRYAASEDEINDLLSPEEAKRVISNEVERQAKMREENAAFYESLEAKNLRGGVAVTLDTTKTVDITVPEAENFYRPIHDWSNTLSSAPMEYDMVMFQLDPKEPIDMRV